MTLSALLGTLLLLAVVGVLEAAHLIVTATRVRRG